MLNRSGYQSHRKTSFLKFSNITGTIAIKNMHEKQKEIRSRSSSDRLNVTGTKINSLKFSGLQKHNGLINEKSVTSYYERLQIYLNVAALRLTDKKFAFNTCWKLDKLFHSKSLALPIIKLQIRYILNRQIALKVHCVLLKKNINYFELEL